MSKPAARAAAAVLLLAACTGSVPGPRPEAAAPATTAAATTPATTPATRAPVAGEPVPVSGVRVTADDRTLVVSTDRTCTVGEGFGARVEEDAAAVRLVVRAGVPAAYRMPCDATYYATRLHLRLDRPLAGRAVVDAASGRRVPVFRPAELLAPTRLPAGFADTRPFEHGYSTAWAMAWDHDGGDMVLRVSARRGGAVERAHCDAPREVRARGRTMLACGWDADSQGGELRWVEGGLVREVYLGFAEAAGEFPYTLADARRVVEGLRATA